MLITAHDSWKLKNKSTPFTGPITFLLACYVDRVVYRTRLVVRRFPTDRNWTTSLLKERGDMEFNNGGIIGRGSVESIINPVSIEALYVNKDSTDEAPSTGNTGNTIPVAEAPSTDEAAPSTNEAPLSYEIRNSIREAAATITKMMKYMKGAPASSNDANCFKVATINALKMVGVEVAQGDQAVSNPVDNMTQAMEEDQEDDPEWIELMEKILEAHDEKCKLVNEGDK
ncbi:uncharacterized protein LOC121741405 [Salvia splendens]|uniref:uncharacterized protein LOC121741405 n=1 Tax=Salvia splendens TaxID=180675 RepID=UPI001C279630|nr:uncharacterized protein LOC121741405 [Salvia splendens]